MRLLFTATIFVNAALLFLVQPLIAKMALPLFGGSPAVWIVSMLFFQTALLAGYAYAHGITRFVKPALVPWIHVLLLAAAGLTLPLALPAGFEPPASADPSASLLLLLAVVVGPSFVLLSGGAPLLQRWYAGTGADDARDPYFLYSASNVGSMLALLAYPVLLEPLLRLAAQSRVWAWGYALLLAGAVGCAARVRKAAPDKEAHPGPKPTPRLRASWVALAAVPSSLLLGVTTYLTSNLTPIPLLWVVPLALYLATFIAAFARKPLASSAQLGRMVPLLATPLALALVLEASEPLGVLAGLHLVAFTVAAWMCHARLVESRPDAAHLTEFYLWIALGGALGGAFNALAAPPLFSTLLEYPLALAAVGLLLPARHGVPPASPRWRGLLWPLGVGALVVVASLATRAAGLEPGPARTMLVIGVPAILCFFAAERPLAFGLSLAALFVTAQALDVAAGSEVLEKRRSFFGVHRVLAYENEAGTFHQLVHGNTTHGLQNGRDPATPLTYYHPTGPAGQVFRFYSGPRAKRAVGLVGLGVGSLAAYGEPGQRYVYYEIDPVVDLLARDERWFTFLRDSKASVETVLGDARLTLARAPDGGYGIVVLDAFSSDAIPMHLVTVEAIEMAVSKLERGGVLLFHISNRYLDLRPPLGGAAAALGLSAWTQDDTEVDDSEVAAGKFASKWVMMARRPEDVEDLLAESPWSPLEEPESRAWTDDFSNLLRAIDPSTLLRAMGKE